MNLSYFIRITGKNACDKRDQNLLHAEREGLSQVVLIDSGERGHASRLPTGQVGAASRYEASQRGGYVKAFWLLIAFVAFLFLLMFPFWERT